VLGLQFDPTHSRALINQRHADLIDEARQQRLIDEAMRRGSIPTPLRLRLARMSLLQPLASLRRATNRMRLLVVSHTGGTTTGSIRSYVAPGTFAPDGAHPLHRFP
jgi:hypothetical protein